MNITHPVLTINQDTGTRIAQCIAGCRGELNTLEAASLLNPLHPGFTLRCVLIGDDPGTADPVIFTYPLVVRLGAINAFGINQAFTSNVSFEILNEDLNGADEIRAVFTLMDLSTGQRAIRRSPRVTITV